MATAEFIEMEPSGLSIGLASPPPEVLLTPNIGVMGVGGAGGNAIDNMVLSGLSGVSFYVANTDAQALFKSLVADRIQLGVQTTKGLGAGANPEVGRKSAEESAEKIHEYLEGLHLLFLTAGMGGGTGTGALPVIAKQAQEMGILTVAVVSKPFLFEGPQRMRRAEEGIAELQKHVDTLILIPNQNLFRVAEANTTFTQAFKMADDVLCQGVRSITDLVMNPGLVNLDFADVRTVLTTAGRAIMGTAKASGEGRAEVASEKVLHNPLLDDSSIKGAKSILINVSGGMDITLTEMDIVNQRILSESPDAQVIVGVSINEQLGDELQVSLVATGIDRAAGCATEQVAAVPPPRAPEKPVSLMPTFDEDLDEAPDAPIKEENEPSLIQNDGLSFAPLPDLGIDAPPKDLVIEVTETEVITQSPLFDEEVPPPLDVRVSTDEVPEGRPEINLDSKKADANVKAARPSLFDLVPGFMSKSTRPDRPKPEKKEKAKDVDAAPSLGLDEPIDLPSFFLRK